MKSREEHLAELTEIRSLMERSSRFISLSGLSGIFAGLCALGGAVAVYWYFGVSPFVNARDTPDYEFVPKLGLSPYQFVVLTAVIVLISAIGGGIYFTTRKARRKGQEVWNKLSQKLLIQVAIPLIAGGIFCLGLLQNNVPGLIAPSMLVFYGLALINGSKYTLHDVQYLGISEVVLGLVALFVMGYGLEFWAIGFGILHILYGTLMYLKYERN